MNKPDDTNSRLGTAAKRGMVLAAGLGIRMRPMTDSLPKPLIPVNGRTLLDRALDRLEDAGVERVVVNLFHLGHMIEEHLARRAAPEIVFSPEAERLETGGGVAGALPLLGDQPFFVVNGDILWLNGVDDALVRLRSAWNDGIMDGLLLVHSTVEAYGYSGRGDFIIDPAGAVRRRQEGEVAPFLFTGVQIFHRRLFDGAPGGAYSLNLLYDKAIGAGRLYAVVHDGEWFHVGTPEGLAQAEQYLEARYAGIRHR